MWQVSKRISIPYAWDGIDNQKSRDTSRFPEEPFLPHIFELTTRILVSMILQANLFFLKGAHKRRWKTMKIF